MWALPRIFMTHTSRTWWRGAGGALCRWSATRAKGRCSQVRLLVDADQFSPAQITEALALFHAKDAKVVETRIFAAPGRRNNKQMQELLQTASVKFHAVPRTQRPQLGEPNDEAIVAEMQVLAKKKASNEWIALMTADKGFTMTIKLLVSKYYRVLVLVPRRYVPVVQHYESEGIPVIQLGEEPSLTKVRAVLDVHGNGTVHLADSYANVLDRTRGEEFANTLHKLFKGVGEKQRCEADYLSIHRIAKLWFVNGLGSLVVYPFHVALDALHSVVHQQPDRRWILDNDKLVYVLPVARGGKTKALLNIYGSRLAHSIFKGDGPFMLRDSEDLVIRVLRRLGYLDDNLNSDLSEAMFVFLNSAENKVALRKMGITFDLGDTTADIACKLREAFLCERGSGRWKVGGISDSDPDILQAMKVEKCLPEDTGNISKDELFDAMKTFARVHQLEDMKTYNGLAFNVLQHIKRADPLRRGNIIIKT